MGRRGVPPVRRFACTSFCLFSGVQGATSLRDRSALVQGSVHVTRNEGERQTGVTLMADPVAAAAYITKQVESNLHEATLVHHTAIRRLPGASGEKWNGDTVRTFSSITAVNGTEKEGFGIIGAGNEARNTSHGVYGTLSSKQGSAKVMGVFKGDGPHIQFAHAQLGEDGKSYHVTNIENEHKSLSAGAGLEKLQSEKPQGALLLAAAPQRHAKLGELSLADSMAALVSAQTGNANASFEPFSADTVTIAYKQTDNKTGSNLGMDDIIGTGSHIVISDKEKGGFGGIGGYSSADQSYHFLYGSGHVTASDPVWPPKDGTIGTVVGKPGKLDVAHIAATSDGGADLTSIRSRTQHLSKEEVKHLFESGKFTIPTFSPEDSSPAVAETTTVATVESTTTTQSSSSSSSSSSTTTAPSSTTTAPSSTTTAPSSTTTAPSSTSSTTSTSTMVAGSNTTTVAPDSTNVTDDFGSQAFPPVTPSSLVWSDLTNKVGPVVGNDTLSSFEDLLGSGGLDLAVKVTEALSGPLTELKEESQKLLEKTQTTKEETLKTIQAAVGWESVKALEIWLYRNLNILFQEWETLSESVTEKTDGIVHDLKAAGQVGLAKEMRATAHNATASIDHFVTLGRDSIKQLHGISMFSPGQVQVVMSRVNEGLYECSRPIEYFGPYLERTFQNVVDHISDALSPKTGNPQKIQRTFSSVPHLTTAVTWRARGAARELFTGGHQALQTVADKINIKDVAWPPNKGDETSKSAASRGPVGLGRLLLLVGALSAIAHAAV